MQTDGELLKLVAQGREESFLALYRRHQGPVFRFALHMSGRVETAEEVVQEVFLSLLSHSHRFAETNGNLQGYLIGMARNMIRAHLRQASRFLPENPAAATETAIVDSLTKEQDLRDLHSAILSLPANYREAVVLCDLEGLDYERAANHLDCPVGTVRSRLYRARALLTAKLKKRIRCSA